MVSGDLRNGVVLVLAVVSGGRRVCSGDVLRVYTGYILLGLWIGLRLCVCVIIVGGRCMLADLLSNENESSARVGPPGTSNQLPQGVRPITAILYHLHAVKGEAMQHVENTLSWSAFYVPSALRFMHSSIKERRPTCISKSAQVCGSLPPSFPSQFPVLTSPCPSLFPLLHRL
jgi:hypothetical protein